MAEGMWGREGLFVCLFVQVEEPIKREKSKVL